MVPTQGTQYARTRCGPDYRCRWIQESASKSGVRRPDRRARAPGRCRRIWRMRSTLTLAIRTRTRGSSLHAGQPSPPPPPSPHANTRTPLSAVYHTHTRTHTHTHTAVVTLSTRPFPRSLRSLATVSKACATVLFGDDAPVAAAGAAAADTEPEPDSTTLAECEAALLVLSSLRAVTLEDAEHDGGGQGLFVLQTSECNELRS